MTVLLAVSLVWAMSFGLIKNGLAGMDTCFVAMTRMGLSFLLFLPWLRPGKVPPGVMWRLAAVGALQFGVMYVAYIESFRHLQAHQVAVFTIFTPFYVTLLHDLADRRLRPGRLLAVALAVLGSGLLVYREIHASDLGLGFVLVQVSNLCFAAGQVLYPRLLRGHPGVRDPDVFACLYGGALAVTVLASLAHTDWSRLTVTPAQAGVLLYLGLIASGLCFFLWDMKARQVNPGLLAIANNLKIPFAILCSVLFFGESISWPKLALGGALIGLSLVLNQRLDGPAAPPVPAK